MDRSLILRNLATPYDVIDNLDGSVSKIFVIESGDLYKMVDEIPQKPNRISKGIKKNPYEVTWHCSNTKEFIIEDAVAQAKIDGNDIVVVEFIAHDAL